jgi:hypothetical protein
MASTALVVAASAAPAVAGAPKFEGKYDVVETIKDNDFGIAPGSKTVQTWIADCANGKCSEVKLTRKDEGGKHKMTLEKSGSKYTGSEGPIPYDGCTGNEGATFTTDVTVKPSDIEGTEVKKFSGTERFEAQHCEFGTFIVYKIKGI